MKYAFFGTPRFAEIILDRLIAAGAPPAVLVCNPDRPAGRKKVLTAPLTKQRALQRGTPPIAIMQPETLDGNFIAAMATQKPDLAIVAAYAKIIPQEVLDIPRLGTIGAHPSLLPKYRGASPIQSVILEDQRKTGASIYKMDSKMDHGPVFAAEALSFDPLTTGYAALEKQLAELSATLLLRVLPDILSGRAAPKEQDHTQATFTKKFSTDDAFIDEAILARAESGADTMTAVKVLCAINAFNPEPGAWTMRAGKRIKLLKGKIADGRLVLTETRSS